jgi:LysM repeat protein
MPTAYFGTTAHTVKQGDTLYSIAHTYNSTIGNILAFNRIADPNRIRVGHVIVVPLSPPEAIIYTVKQGDTLYQIAQAYGTTVHNLTTYNYLSPPYVIYPGQQLVVTASQR